MRRMLDFIPNGHRRKAKFNEVPKVHRAFEFTYLPFRGSDGSDALAACMVDGALDKQRHRSAIVERLVSWDFSRPMDEAALRDMAAPMFQKIAGVVFDYAAPDDAQELDVPADESNADDDD